MAEYAGAILGILIGVALVTSLLMIMAAFFKDRDSR